MSSLATQPYSRRGPPSAAASRGAGEQGGKGWPAGRASLREGVRGAQKRAEGRPRKLAARARDSDDHNVWPSTGSGDAPPMRGGKGDPPRQGEGRSMGDGERATDLLVLGPVDDNASSHQGHHHDPHWRPRPLAVATCFSSSLPGCNASTDGLAAPRPSVQVGPEAELTAHTSAGNEPYHRRPEEPVADLTGETW